ncbi:MAG: undecaprenyldiphospho-muramoylpentapeptide beta-N-acetylglucosaminyltransferase [Burkholderiales bacterium]|nr:undecaprenyldiphospho-muramoylpentapeptide beta-N-acetylglucosaminyltransferase [Burkholderiales bacterium]
MTKKTILITAGGTGGHIFPALSIAKQLQQQYNVLWVGAHIGIENEIIPKHNIPLLKVTISGLRKKGLIKILLLPWILARAFYQCLKIILCERPDIVVGFGGYVTGPLCATAWLLKIPMLIHEQNSVPGLTNKVLARLATKVMTGFPAVLVSKKTVYVGNPVREDILKLEAPDIRYLRRSGGLNLLIVGGSLGAQVLNELMPQVCAKLVNVNHVIHQVGRGDLAQVKQRYQDLSITQVEVVPFIEDMAQAYANSDLIICRSGASTVSEVASVGIAAIFVPYPHAVDDHQWYNAQMLSMGAHIIRQAEFNVEKLAGLINSMDRSTCLTMAKNGQQLAIKDSVERIVSLIKKSIS